MELDDYQQEAAKTDQRPGRSDDALAFPLLGIASEAGSLVDQFKKRVRDGDSHELFTERIRETLGDVLWYVANLATKLDHRLDDIAQLNLKRTRQRWPVDGAAPMRSALDDGWPSDERLPPTLTAEFIQVQGEGEPQRVELRINGELVGDPLFDMAHQPDDYRFHDAIHLSFAALLGWSPVVRSMLGRQRESDPTTRRVEDSGRAKVIEEAVSALAFEYVGRNNYLDGVQHVDSEVLRTILGLVSHLEVRVRTAREWEHALVQAFRLWRGLRAHGGGRVEVDLAAGALTFSG